MFQMHSLLLLQDRYLFRRILFLLLMRVQILILPTGSGYIVLRINREVDPSVVWDYIPSPSGTLKLPSPHETGMYKAFLLCCNVWDTIAISEEFMVVVPVLTSSKSSYIEGDSIVFSYVSPRFSETDWIGIFPDGTKPGDENQSIDREYIPDSAGTMTFKSALDPGTYDAYLLCCDGYDSLAAFTFEIKDANVAFVDPNGHAIYLPVRLLKLLIMIRSMLTETGLEFISKEMIRHWFHPWYGSTITSKSGTVSFPGTLAGGSYFAVLFCCGTSETEYARSSVFTVEAGAVGTYVKTTASVYPAGAKDYLLITGIRTGLITDWIGIYPKGINPGDQESTLWQYAESDSGYN